jgi:sugar phosphate isomerase/epimerase
MMKRIKLGVCLESLGLPLRRGLLEAERLGLAGVQVDARGDLSPQALSQTGRREFRHLLRAHNLELSALGCPLRHGLDVAENLEARMEHVKQIMSLSFDLGPGLVVVQAGHVHEKFKDPRYPLLCESLLALGRHGDRVGAVLALETGLESGEVLRAILDRMDTGGLGVNFDPANLLMHGIDVNESLRALRDRVKQIHAKDARAGKTSRAAQEVPLGHGDIDWMDFLSVLEEIEYGGYLTIEREVGENRLADVAAGVAFLRRFVG